MAWTKLGFCYDAFLVEQVVRLHPASEQARMHLMHHMTIAKGREKSLNYVNNWNKSIAVSHSRFMAFYIIVSNQFRSIYYQVHVNHLEK